MVDDQAGRHALETLSSQSVAVFATVVLASLACIAYYSSYHPLANVPGPRVASFTRLWLLRVIRRWKLHEEMDALHDRYGPVVRVAPSHVWINDPNLFKTIYGAVNGYDKTEWYSVAGPPDGRGTDNPLDLLREFDMDRYRLQRRLIGPVYGPANVKKYESMQDTTIKQFMDKMKELQGQVLDLPVWAMIIAIDSMSYLTWSKDSGLIQVGHTQGVLPFSDKIWKGFATKGLFPQTHVYQFYYDRYQEKIRGFVLSLLRIKQEQFRGEPLPFVNSFKWTKSRRTDFESGMHRSDMTEDLHDLHARKPAFQDHWVEPMSSTNIGGGHDTITLTLTSILSHISWLDGCQARIHEELTAARKDGRLDDIASYEQTKELVYLNACMHEAMRLEPIFVQPLPRKVPASGLKAGDHYLPPNTTVGMSPLLLHRNKDIFGSDADKFNPSRWLDNTPQKVQEMNSNLMIWGGPSRVCPGQFLAKQLLPKFVATLIMRFEVDVLRPEEAEQLGHHLVEESQFMMHRKGIMFRLKER